MCKSVKEIRFCSCLKKGDQQILAHHKNSRTKKNERATETNKVYGWVLSKYAGHSDFQMDGILVEPANLLNKAITDVDLLAELNNRNCFDFNYKPNQGDNLEVWTEQTGQQAPMSFIFENGRWKIAQYNKFTEKTEKINQGNIRFEKNE